MCHVAGQGLKRLGRVCTALGPPVAPHKREYSIKQQIKTSGQADRDRGRKDKASCFTISSDPLFPLNSGAPRFHSALVSANYEADPVYHSLPVL